MPRIRSVKPEFFRDPKLAADLTRDQRLFYEGLWVEADDQGRLVANARALLGAIFPYDEDITLEWIECALQRLADTQRLVFYVVDEMRYAVLTKFTAHQKINRPTPSKLPAPPRLRVVSGSRSGSRSGSVSGSRKNRKGLTAGVVRGRGGEQGAGSNGSSVSPLPSVATKPAQGADEFSTSSDPNGERPSAAAAQTVHAEFMPLLRNLGFAADDTDGSILKALEAKGREREAIEYAVRGLAAMRDDGQLRDAMGVTPTDQLTMRMLYADQGKHLGERPFWGAATDYYVKKLGQQRAAGLSGPQAAGSVLRGMLEAGNATH